MIFIFLGNFYCVIYVKKKNNFCKKNLASASDIEAVGPSSQVLIVSEMESVSKCRKLRF